MAGCVDQATPEGAANGRPNAATAYDLPLQRLSTPPERVPIATLNLERGSRSHRVQQGVLAAYEWLSDGHVVKRRPGGTVVWPPPAAFQPPSTVQVRVFRSHLRNDGAPVGPERILVECSSSADKDCVHLDQHGIGEVRFPWREPGARNVVVFATWYVAEPLSTPPDRGDEIKELSASWLFRAS